MRSTDSRRKKKIKGMQSAEGRPLGIERPCGWYTYGEEDGKEKDN